MWIVLLLISGDIVSSALVKYSGEEMTWRACPGSLENPGDYAEFVISSAETGFLVSEGSAPLSGDRFTYTATIPRVGLYTARARACNDVGCSDWTESTRNAQGPVDCSGPDYVYSVLAPTGAPEL